jgi:DNA-nicking Smr family endonuclease
MDMHKEESIAIVLDMCRRTNFEKVDLHGLYLEEAEEVVMMVMQEVRERVRRSTNIKNSRGGGKNLEIVTGKGLHSKGKAVLFPKIKAYLES